MTEETTKTENSASVGGRVDAVVMRFRHDCKHCVPLGRDNGHDLYYCNQHGIPTVIARFGDDGRDYKSGMGFVGVIPELTKAEKLARDKGLIGICTPLTAAGEACPTERS